MTMPLTDELVLLSYDETGAAGAGTYALDYGLAGALLMELMLADRISVREGRVAVIDPGRTGDALVDAALAEIAGHERGREPVEWISELSTGVRQRVLDRLVAAGVLRRVRQRVMLVFHRERYPSATGVEPAPRLDARRRLTAAVDAAAVDARTAALCALVRAVGIEGLAVPDRPKREVRARLKEVADASWPADAVRAAVEAVEAAVLTAVTSAATTAAAAGR